MAGAAAAPLPASEHRGGVGACAYDRRPNLRAGDCCAIDAARGVFAEVVDDGAGGGERLVMIVQAEAGEFGDAELFAQGAREA